MESPKEVGTVAKDTYTAHALTCSHAVQAPAGRSGAKHSGAAVI